MIEELIVTEDHIKLLQRMYIDFDPSCYEGAPYVNIKRPYGNSDVVADIFELTSIGKDLNGIDEEEYEEYIGSGQYDEDREKALALHREMEHVLQILTCNAPEGIKLGKYKKILDIDSTSWRYKGK